MAFDVWSGGYPYLTNATVFTLLHDEGVFTQNTQLATFANFLIGILFSLDAPNFI